MGFFKGLGKLLFPPRCMFCRAVIDEGYICKSCDASIPRCGALARRGEFFSGCASALYYEGSVRGAVLRYKFSGKRAYAAGFAPLMAKTAREELEGDFDVITWVPVSARRLRARGYDQSRLLAEGTARELGRKAVRTLKKSRHTRKNSSLESREQRAANVLGAYEVVDREAVRGKRVLLVDDIFTTGATMAECSRVLLMAGAEDVVGLTAAAARRAKK